MVCMWVGGLPPLRAAEMACHILTCSQKTQSSREEIKGFIPHSKSSDQRVSMCAWGP